jgi:hypothetical protein
MAEGNLKKEPARDASSTAHGAGSNMRRRRIQCAQEHRLLLPNVVNV